MSATIARSGAGRRDDDARSAPAHDLAAAAVRAFLLVGESEQRVRPGLGEERRRDGERRDAAGIVEMPGPMSVPGEGPQRATGTTRSPGWRTQARFSAAKNGAPLVRAEPPSATMP